MGSISINLKNPDAWEGGRNARFIEDLAGRIGAADARSIADLAIKEATPVGGTLRDGVAQQARKVREFAESAIGARRDERRGSARSEELKALLGEEIARRYLVAEESPGRVALYETSDKPPVIRLEKNRISTEHERGAAISDSVKLAIERGWRSLKLEGTQDYRDAVWLEAKKYDLKVGHKPSPAVRAEFDRWRHTNELIPLPVRASVAKSAQPQQAVPAQASDEKANLGREFLRLTAEQRIGDPRLRNAELTARAARDLARQRFDANDPKLKIALASIDRMISQRLNRGHRFSMPQVLTQKLPSHSSTRSQPSVPGKFDRPRI
ncbi:MAG: hypothetical protein KGL48_11295 [Sphingomonadales bacterium]|nr:hypothetical protein [Sphingomonadales bacterium]